MLVLVSTLQVIPVYQWYFPFSMSLLWFLSVGLNATIDAISSYYMHYFKEANNQKDIYMKSVVLLVSLAAFLFNAYSKVDTIYVNSLEEFKKGLIVEDVKPQLSINSGYLSEEDRRRSKLLYIGGTSTIVTGVGLLPAGATVGFIGMVVDEYDTIHGLVVLGSGMMVIGVVGIVGGIKMIRKGKQIRRRNRVLSFAPCINPLENSYGANFSFSF